MADQSEHSPALDALYEALGEVHAHLHQHAQEREQLTSEVEQMERDLLDQREAAAQAGERDTYNQLSEDLAHLTRAWRALQEDPDADPLDEYQPDESTPDQPNQEETDHDPERGTNRPVQADGLRRQGDQPDGQDESQLGDGGADEPDADGSSVGDPGDSDGADGGQRPRVP